MKPPLFFHGPNGDWDVSVFRDNNHAEAYCEPIDVLNGEYGDNGWDADGLPMKLVVEREQASGIRALFRPPARVRVRRLEEEAARPDELRRVLLRFLLFYADGRSESLLLESLPLERLVDMMWRRLNL